MTDHLQWHRDVFLNRLTLEHLVGGFHTDGADQGRLLSHGGAELAALDRCLAIIGTIKADDQHLLARGLSGTQGTQGHLIVLSEHRLDVRMGGQQVFHDVQPLGAVKVGRL